MMDEHYTQEETQDITLEGIEPLMNSWQYHFALMGDQFFRGDVRINNNAGMVMNIAFRDGEEPDLKEGQFSTWMQNDEEHDCRIIRRTRAFIKGIWIVLYIVQLKDMK